VRERSPHCVLNDILGVALIAKNRPCNVEAEVVMPVYQLAGSFSISGSSLCQQYFIAGRTNLNSGA
jgi:hypothetical protein